VAIPVASCDPNVEEPKTCEERSAENCAGRLAGAEDTGCRWVEGIVSADPEGNCGVTTGACLALNMLRSACARRRDRSAFLADGGQLGA
jgi:hypothetical protein